MWRLSAPRVVGSLLSVTLVIALAGSPPKSKAEEPAKPDAAVMAIQGKWTRTQQTPNGPVRLLKEHRGNKTSLVAYDPKGNVLYAHDSEFRVETTGRVQLLTFFNRKVTAGPDKGQEEKGESSFIYRVRKDEFIEVWGVLESDPSPPGMILWKRPADRPIGNEAAFRDPSGTKAASAIQLAPSLPSLPGQSDVALLSLCQ